MGTAELAESDLVIKMTEVSKNQILLFKIIRDKYPTAQFNYPIKTKNCIRHGDIVLPSKKLIIEYDCDSWHDKSKDRRRDKELKEIGWTTIRTTRVNEEILEEIENELKHNSG